MLCYMKINKNELYDLYLNQNLSIKELALYYNMSITSINRALRYNKIFKPKELSSKNSEKTFMRKYGVKNPSCLNEIKDKKKQTFKKHYNCNHYFQTADFKKQAKQTKQRKYKNENFNNRELARQTNIITYGVENVSQLEEIKHKKRQTTIINYGVDNVSKAASVKQKKKETCIKNYGVDCCIRIPNMLEKILRKGLETKRKNGTFNGKEFIIIDNKKVKCSDLEKKVYLELIKKYTVKYQYVSEDYPFLCDFYIPEIDLYIEIQGYWMHGIHKSEYLGPYDKDNLLHQKVLNEWLQKSKLQKQYKYAIEVWTKRDPLKRQIAKEKNLNWVEFFTFDEFMNWYKKL